MEVLIYLKTICFILILSLCGFIIVRRICEDLRIQILLPTAVVTGIAIFIFLLNFTAFIIKGSMGFYIALALEILLTYLFKVKIRPKEVIFPKRIEKIFWIVSALIWLLFLFKISATGSATSADWMHNSYFASMFLRGDFPIHDPFQPDRLSSYHVGVPIILSALRSFTNGADAFLGSTIALISLFTMSQILQWILKVKNNIFNLMLLIFIPLTVIVSLGNFMVVWPYQLSFPQINNGLGNWLHNLPTLSNTYNAYGAPASLDSLTLFLHRMLALSIFSALIPFLLFPNKLKSFFSAFIIMILLAALALSDEAVFIVTAPASILILFFTLFQENLKFWILFCLITFVVIIFQGGLVNEVIFKSNGTVAKVLLFPDDNKNPSAKFEKYRSYRLEAQSSKMMPDKAEYSPFKWFHFGAVWQVTTTFIACIISILFFKNKSKDKSPLYLAWLFSFSGLIALVAFHAIVPEGWTHINGNRFLSLSYQLSGAGIIILIILGWINLKINNGFKKYFSFVVKIFLLWLVVVSILPTIAILFPREKLNWFKNVIDTPKPEYLWIQDNLKVNTRMLPFMETFPTASPVMGIVTRVGIFTPAWYDKPETQGFDVSPAYFDLFFTQNPEILKALKVEYIMTNKLYRSTLPAKRLDDLKNTEYFKIVYSDKEEDVIISKILPRYLLKAINYKGTFFELSKILPANGAFFIERPPGIAEGVWRAAFLTLQMRDFKMYYSLEFIPIYNFIINVHLKFNGESNDKYDYLVLGPKTDPQSIVKNKTELFWSQIGGYVNIWKVN